MADEKVGTGIDRLFTVFSGMSFCKTIPFYCNLDPKRGQSLSVIKDWKLYLCYFNWCCLVSSAFFQLYQWLQFLETELDEIFLNLIIVIGYFYCSALVLHTLWSREELRRFIDRLQNHGRKVYCEF